MNNQTTQTQRSFQKGDYVKVVDGSDADGLKGHIDIVQAGGLLILVLDNGCVWPVTENEIILVEDPKS